MTAQKDIDRAVEIAREQSEKRLSMSFRDPLTETVEAVRFEMIRVLLEDHPDIYEASLQMRRDIELIADQMVSSKTYEVGRCTYGQMFDGDAFTIGAPARDHRIRPEGVREVISWFAEGLRKFQTDHRADGWVMCPHEVMRIMLIRDANTFDAVLIFSFTAGKLDAGALERANNERFDVWGGNDRTSSAYGRVERGDPRANDPASRGIAGGMYRPRMP